MWLEFFRFDIRYQLRQPLLWVAGLVMAALAFGASTTDAIQIGTGIGNINRNAPVVIVTMLGVFTLMSMLIVTIFLAGALLRDTEIGIADMLFATPMRKVDYLLGRFTAGILACFVIFVLVAFGLMLGPCMPWVDATRVGAFSLYPYFWGFAVIVLPDLLFIGALLMLLAAVTRSMMMVYVGVLAFFILWGVAGVFARDVQYEWISVLVDPLGIRSLARMTRYFSNSESNTILPPFSGFLLANRALWSGIAILMLAATVMLFKPQRAGSGRRRFGRATLPVASTSVLQTTAPHRLMPRFSPATAWQQWTAILRLEASSVFRSVPFLVMLLFAVLNFVASATLGGELYGTSVYPVTRMMLQTLSSSFNFMLVIVVTFYAGEMIFRERQVHIADVTDALPVPDWIPLAAKSVALGGVILSFLLGGVVTAIGFQLIRGGVSLEPLLYLKAMGLTAFPFTVMALCAIALQVYSNNKFLGYLLMAVLLVSQIVLGILHFDHNLYNIGALPAIQYSDMNGYGHFVRGWLWFALYWGLFCLLLMIAAQLLSVRGLAHGWRGRLALAAQRLRGSNGRPLATVLTLALAGFVVTGCWIFYNTNVQNDYLPGDQVMDRQAAYEKQYRRFLNLPHPKIIDVTTSVDIFPAERRVAIDGHYRLQNKSALPQDTLRIQVNPNLDTVWRNLPPHRVVLDDRVQGFRVLALTEPLAPGQQLDLHFESATRKHGFTNDGMPDTINLNGTFFNNIEFFPQFGYQPGKELGDRNERRKRGLGEPIRLPKLEDQAARSSNDIGADADWINFQTTVSTSDDQIALAPGYLQKQWQKDGRRFYQYQMDRPMLNFFAFLSGRWEIRKGQWHGMPIEVYYDAKHGYNVDRMITAAQKSFDYFNTQFTPYQQHQLRIIEFPGYKNFAQSFANTVPYSEGIGFIADLRDQEKVDYVFFVTAHEIAHQWWGHQVVGANVQGSAMLSESLAQYSALMVMEKEYGAAHLRRFFRQELDQYLRSRGTEKIEELPLYRVENQPYIHYRKGSMIFYRLRDEIGEVALNRALKRFLQDKGYQQPPYTTSQELLDYIRAETPADKQQLITDLFEKIVFYDNRVTSAKATPRVDGKWDVAIQLHLAKFMADGKGKETPMPMSEPIEMQVFARGAGQGEMNEKVLLSEKRRFDGGDPVVTVTVSEKPYEVGVDSYNKMIDRNSSDNRRRVSF